MRDPWKYWGAEWISLYIDFELGVLGSADKKYLGGDGDGLQRGL